jgi:hypothetical protein
MFLFLFLNKNLSIKIHFLILKIKSKGGGLFVGKSSEFFLFFLVKIKTNGILWVLYKYNIQYFPLLTPSFLKKIKMKERINNF